MDFEMRTKNPSASSYLWYLYKNMTKFHSYFIDCDGTPFRYRLFFPIFPLHIQDDAYIFCIL